MSGASKESAAGWHGLTTWAVNTLVIFYLQERYGRAKDQVRKEIDDWYGTQRW